MAYIWKMYKDGKPVGGKRNEVCNFTGETSIDASYVPDLSEDEIPLFASGQTETTLLTKLAKFVKSMRWMLGKLGDTSKISNISDATVCGSIKALNDNLSDNNFQTGIDISSYTLSNPYVATKDGFVYIYNSNSTNGFVYVLGATSPATGDYRIGIGGASSMMNAIPIRKGMRIYTDRNPYQARIFYYD